MTKHARRAKGDGNQTFTIMAMVWVGFTLLFLGFYLFDTHKSKYRTTAQNNAESHGKITVEPTL